jgi:PAS domain S-box-containing protein
VVKVQELADILPSMVAFIDAEGIHQFANKKYCDWFGGVVGKHLRDVLPPDFFQTVLPYYERAWAGEEVQYEAQMTSSLNPELRGCFATTLVPHSGGFYLYRHDVSKQMGAEAIHRSIVDHAVDPIIVVNSKGAVQSINPSGIKKFGYTTEEIVGRNVSVLFPNHAKNHFTASVKKMVGESSEIEAYRKDGSSFPVILTVSEWCNGDESYFTGMITDISQRKEDEIELKRLNKKLRRANETLEEKVEARVNELDLIFRMSADILGVINYEGRFESVSPAFVKITGRDIPDFLTRQFTDFIHPDDVEATTAEYQQAILGKHISGFVLRIIHADGSVRWTSWSVTPMPEQRKMFAVGRDITQQKIQEEALRQSQKMEAIGQLTGGIAHDFNNLLMGITGSLDLMERKLSDDSKETVQRYLDGAVGSAKRAASLTHRLLAFSRRQPLAPKTVNINDLTGSMEDLISRTIGPEIEVLTRLDPEIWATSCDPNQLESAVLNLMINARDAIAESGRVVITTSNIAASECSSEGVPQGEYVCLTVTDNGSGMPEDVITKAFDPFFTTKPIGQGTGLGLSMLYGFVHQTGGHVRMHSKLGNGTTVSIYLPRSHESQHSMDFNVVLALPLEKKQANKTILVIEDEEVIRDLVHDVLTSEGYKCITAAEGNAALKAVSDRSQEIDLVVSDVGLPGLNGKQVAELSRQIRPELKVLFITGYAAGVTLRNNFLLQGMDMLLKPFTMDSLVAKVEEMLEDNG